MAEVHKQAIGGSAAVVTTAIGVYLGGGDHPHIAVSLYIVAVLCAAYMLLQWPVVHKILGLQSIPEKHEPSSLSDVKRSAHAGRDNTGAQFGSGNIVGTDALRELARLSKDQSSPPTVEQPTEELLHFGNLEYDLVRLSRGAILRSKNGEEAVFLPVYNLTPKILPKGRSYDLAAHLVFYEEQTIIANVARAYWLENQYNDANLRIGDNASIVIGLRHKPGVWTALGNRFVRPTMHFSNITIPLADKSVFAVKHEIRVEVALVNIHSGETVGRCELTISPNSDEAPEVRKQ